MPPDETPSPDAPEPDEGPPPADAPLLRLRDGLGKIVETEAGLAEVCEAMARGTRSGRDRRRARLRLPLLRPRLPDPAAPRGRRHLPGRPDRVRLAGAAAAGPRGHRVDPARRDPGPALPQRGRPVPDEALRHRARRPPARLPARRPGHAGRDPARLPDGQGALGRRLVDPSAAGAVAGVRRPRRRGPRRAARGARRRAGRGRQGRLGRRGVRVAQAFTQTVRVDQWRRTSGLHKVRGRRALGAVARPVDDARPDRGRARRDPEPDHPRLRDRGGRARHAHHARRP